MKRVIAKIFGRRVAKEALNFSSVESVLLKPIGNAIGDAVIHILHLTQIKKAYPNVKTAVLVTPRNRALFEQANCVDILFEDKFSTYLSQRGKWQIYLDFQPNFTSKEIILDYVLNPQYVVNFGKEDKGYYRLDSVRNYDYSARFEQATHLADYLNNSKLNLVSKKNHQIEYGIIPEQERKNKMEELWGNKPIKILLNPQGSLRQIPPAELKFLLQSIDPEYYSLLSFILTNTTNSEEYLTHLNLPFEIKLSPQLDILDYCALIDSADLVIAVDGGGVHLACAFGKPLLSFYANHQKNLARWYPKLQKDVEGMMIVGKNPTTDNNDTQNFPLDEAVVWLNQQIEKRR